MNDFPGGTCNFRGQWVCQVIFTNGLRENGFWTWHVESKFDPNMLWLSKCQALCKFKALKTAPHDQKWHQHQVMPTLAIRKAQMSRDMRGSNFPLPGISVFGDICHVSLALILLEVVTVFLEIAFLTWAPQAHCQFIFVCNESLDRLWGPPQMELLLWKRGAEQWLVAALQMNTVL